MVPLSFQQFSECPQPGAHPFYSIENVWARTNRCIRNLARVLGCKAFYERWSLGLGFGFFVIIYIYVQVDKPFNDCFVTALHVYKSMDYVHAPIRKLRKQPCRERQRQRQRKRQKEPEYRP